MSVLNLYKSDYGISMEYLSKVKTIDIAYRNNVNILSVKIYFCQRQTDSSILWLTTDIFWERREVK